MGRWALMQCETHYCVAAGFKIILQATVDRMNQLGSCILKDSVLLSAQMQVCAINTELLAAVKVKVRQLTLCCVAKSYHRRRLSNNLYRPLTLCLCRQVPLWVWGVLPLCSHYFQNHPSQQPPPSCHTSQSKGSGSSVNRVLHTNGDGRDSCWQTGGGGVRERQWEGRREGETVIPKSERFLRHQQKRWHPKTSVCCISSHWSSISAHEMFSPPVSSQGRRRCVGSRVKAERETSKLDKRGGPGEGENREEQQREVRRRSNRRNDDSERGSDDDEEDEDDEEEEERRRADR